MSDNTIAAGGFQVEFVGPGAARVDLILKPLSSVAALATIVRGYKQVYDPLPPALEEQEALLADINRTKLHTPLEMLNFVWLVRDVTRAFTHQVVRTRVGAAYVQESMRFSDKRQAKVLVPPAIAADANRLGAYKETVAEAFQTYAAMVADGVPIQDARGVLPHNVLTHIFISYTLSTLAKTAALRYCCQAQNMKADGEGEWKSVLQQMRSSLPADLQRFVCAPWEAGEVSCGFEASFDRPCAWPEKFRPNLDALIARRSAPGTYTLPAAAGAAGFGLAPEEKARLDATVAAEFPALGQWANQQRAQAAKPINLYHNGDFTIDVVGSDMVVKLRDTHLWKVSKNGLAIKLYDKMLLEAQTRGAKRILVLNLTDDEWSALEWEEFMGYAIKVPGGDDYGSSRYVLLKDWNPIPAPDLPEGGEA